MTYRDAEFFDEAYKYKTIYFAVMTNGDWHLISEDLFRVFERDPWPEKISELISRMVPAREWEHIIKAANELANAEGISEVQALNKIAKPYDDKWMSDRFSSSTAKEWYDMGIRLKKANRNISAEEAFAKAKEMGYNG